MMKIGQDIYSQAWAEAPAGEAKTNEDGTVDAEVETDENDGRNTTRV
jgi:hypothetical protein